MQDFKKNNNSELEIEKNTEKSEKKSRKKAVQVTAFILGLVLILITLSGSFNPMNWYHIGRFDDRNSVYTGLVRSKKNTIDLLIIGDSLCYSSISPCQIYDKTGISAFVAGQPGQKIEETYSVLKTALRTQKPKVILLETHNLFLYDGYFVELGMSFQEKINRMVPLFRFHNVWKKDFYDNKYLSTVNRRLEYNGFKIRDKIDSYTKESDYMSENRKNIKISTEITPFVEDYFKNIIDMCKEQGIKLVLYSAPSPKCYNYKRHNELIKFTDKYNIEYYDLNHKINEIGIDWKLDSLDQGDHLNISGAEKVTDYLIKDVLPEFNLTDHRGDAQYSGWSKPLKRYYADVDSAYEKMGFVRN
ncbi:MAG: SGNH/GDSL hydrolase family protein [Lachnospiraceae bacterium]|nr:SGNH/GDSL hydrolase family protein [Lachnospiraceae bacterium]